MSITAGLSANQNFGGQKGCHMGNLKCLVDQDTDCRITRSVYKTLCLICQEAPNLKDALYIGTSARTLHSRQLEHLRQINNGTTSNALSNHQMSSNPGAIPRFGTKVIQGGVRFNVEGFIRERVEIENFKNDQNFNLFNQKSEWGHTALPRLRL